MSANQGWIGYDEWKPKGLKNGSACDADADEIGFVPMDGTCCVDIDDRYDGIEVNVGSLG